MSQIFHKLLYLILQNLVDQFFHPLLVKLVLSFGRKNILVFELLPHIVDIQKVRISFKLLELVAQTAVFQVNEHASP